MDDSANRAIMVGAATLIAIITISLVINYYSSAKEMVRNIGSGTDIAYNYREDIKNTLLRGKENISGTESVKGSDVKNLLNYFFDDPTVKINVTFNYNFIEAEAYTSPKRYVNVNNGNRFEEVIKNIILDQDFVITRDEIEEDGLEKLEITLVAK